MDFRKKIVVVIGTRPEAIKMAPLILELQKDRALDVLVCSTGQHREMLASVLELFSIDLSYDLGLMTTSKGITDLLAKVISGLGRIFKIENPSVVLVHGDTASALGAAIAAFYEGIAVGHVEAGLRTGNLGSPWPEEGNRQLIARLSALNFAPTMGCLNNLTTENVPGIGFITGNTVIDSLKMTVQKIHENKDLADSLDESISRTGIPVKKIIEKDVKVVLITGHRRENLDSGISEVCKALSVLSERYPSVLFVYPVHLNPKIRSTISDYFPSVRKEALNALFTEPLSYFEFIRLMSLSYLILTDSGGIQEEAPSLGKPVLVMRDTTERPEAVVSGTVRLIGAKASEIINETAALLEDEVAYAAMARATNPYGDGYASRRIHEGLMSYLVDEVR